MPFVARPTGGLKQHGTAQLQGKRPVLAHDRFVVQYDVDVTDKNSKNRFQMQKSAFTL